MSDILHGRHNTSFKFQKKSILSAESPEFQTFPIHTLANLAYEKLNKNTKEETLENIKGNLLNVQNENKYLQSIIKELKKNLTLFYNTTLLCFNEYDTLLKAKEICVLSESKHTSMVDTMNEVTKILHLHTNLNNNENQNENQNDNDNDNEKDLLQHTTNINKCLYILHEKSEQFKNDVLKYFCDIHLLHWKYPIEKSYIHIQNIEVLEIITYELKLEIYDLFYKKHDIYLYDFETFKNILQPCQIDFLQQLHDIDTHFENLLQLSFWPSIIIFDFLLKHNLVNYSLGFEGLRVTFRSFELHISITNIYKEDFIKIKEIFLYFKILNFKIV